MKVRIPLKTVELIKEFYPAVDINKLHIPVQNKENAFIFKDASFRFGNFLIFSDLVMFYLIVDSVVIRFPVDIDDEYGFDLRMFLFKDFENQTKHVNKNKKAAAIALFYNLMMKAGKHSFNQFFTSLYKEKEVSDITFSSHNNSPRIFFTYWGETFDVEPVFDKGTLLVRFSLIKHKFTRYYSLKKFTIKDFILDFVNEKEHLTSSIDDVKDNFPSYITLRDMRNY